MAHAEDAGRPDTPYDELGRVAVPGAPGWKYKPFERVGRGDDRAIAVTVEREDGARVRFTIPAFVDRSEEIHAVACILIRARERMEATAGLGA
ncbi:MAG TPA: hypothetical protein VE777_21570 [Gaiellales bacterium]|jgi:hypothetical protein|nr:hypothetical protein [Gaiellales bacterium]